MRQFVIPAFGLDRLAVRDVPEPSPGPGEVLVQVMAVSLNYRDLLMAKGQYNPRLPLPRVPCSDAAGVVAAVGDGVTEVKVGDRVCGTFSQDWDDGPMTDAATKGALGGAIDGVLSERVVLKARGVVPVPDHLSFEEAATLPCAAVTAWSALAGMEKEQSVLVQGTGGVSLFAARFGMAMGLDVFATTSSGDKVDRLHAMGVAAATDRTREPDWETWARHHTFGVGVDRVVEVGGAGTLDRSVKAVRTGGEIALIGVLAGGGTFNPLPMMMKGVTLRGLYVGSRATFLAMNEFIARHKLKPVIDRTFPFKDAVAAFRHLESAGHFGKVVIAV